MPELIEVIDRVWDALMSRPGLLLAGVTSAVTGADVVVKVAAVAVLREGQCVPSTSRNVAVCLVRSPGVVSTPTAGVLHLALVVAAVAVCAWWVWRRRSPSWAVALGLVAGGLLGNLVDRLFRAPAPLVGRVVDVFSVGLDVNLADGAIALGVVVMLVLTRFGRRIDDMVRPRDTPEDPERLDPDDEKVALAHRPKYPARKWDPPHGTGGAADDDAADDDAAVDEDDRPARSRPRYPTAKWDRP